MHLLPKPPGQAQDCIKGLSYTKRGREVKETVKEHVSASKVKGGHLGSSPLWGFNGKNLDYGKTMARKRQVDAKDDKTNLELRKVKEKLNGCKENHKKLLN